MKPRSFPLVYPTPVFGGLLFVLFAMWYASASQNNVANYLLLFFTLALFLVSIPHTLLNLNGLKVTVESVKPAFAGKEVAVPIEVAQRVNVEGTHEVSCGLVELLLLKLTEARPT